jgi:acyl dehydratase
MGQPDFSTFPLMRKGRSFEDFEVGAVLEHHWGRTLTEADNVVFSTATCNWNPMHLNAEYARAHDHPDVVVNPMLVLCTVVGLSVEDLSEAGGPFLGMEGCTFHRPVHPGDTLTARSTVVDTRESSSRPTVGIVTWHTEAHNQRGELVVDYRRTNLVAKRRKPKAEEAKSEEAKEAEGA